MAHGSVNTPFGLLSVLADNDAIVGVSWQAQPCGLLSPLVLRALEELEAYFAGTLTRFSVPLAPHGTAFQRKVWHRLASIPYATTATYGDLARELATAPRALAGACACNPLPILIPCHRVVAADGSLGGYSGAGGVTTKAALLTLEQHRRAIPVEAET